MKHLFRIMPLPLVLLLSIFFVGCADGEDIYENVVLVTIHQIGDTEANNFSVKFIPSPQTSKFEYYVGSKDDFASFLNGQLVSKQSVGNVSLVEYIDNLHSNTAYVVFARAFDNEGVAGPIAMLSLVTAGTEEEKSDAVKIVQQFIGSTTANVTFSLTSEYALSRSYLGLKTERESFINGQIQGDVRKETYIFTVNHYDLFPDTEYVLYLMGVDRSNQTQLFEFPINTLGSQESVDVTMDVVFSDFYTTACMFIPNDKCKKMDVLLSEKGMYDPFFEAYNGDVIAAFEELKRNQRDKPVQSSNTEFGVQIVTPDMKLGNPLEVYVVMYGEDDVVPLAIKHYDFTTPPMDPYALGSWVEVNVKDITSQGATYEFSPEDGTALYLFMTIRVEEYEFYRSSNEWHKYYFHQDLLTRGYRTHKYLNSDLWREAYTETEAAPNTRYYLMVAHMNANGPTSYGWGNLVLREYTTLPN